MRSNSLRITCSILASFSVLLVSCTRGALNRGESPSGPHVEGSGHYVQQARIVATGIEGAGAVAQVGVMPTDDTAAMNAERVLVGSTSSFDSKLAQPAWAPGAVLSIDVRANGPIDVVAALASGAPSALLWTAHAVEYANATNNPDAVTSALPSVSNPLALMVHNLTGRVAVASAPTGSDGPALFALLDSHGLPFANARNTKAGGVFSGNETSRSPAIDPADLTAGAVGVAFLGRSPDRGESAYAVVLADGRIVQVDAEDGVDALAPVETLAPLSDVSADAQDDSEIAVSRAGALLGWEPLHRLFVADPAGGGIVVVKLATDAELYRAESIEHITSDALEAPVDLAPAVVETSSPRFASSRTLAVGSDFYVADRGTGRIVRFTQDGDLVATAEIKLPDGTIVGPGQLAGIATSRDGERLWITVTSLEQAATSAGGALLEIEAFGHDSPVNLDHASLASTTDPVRRGELLFATSFTPEEALGPLFNGRSCIECHGAPTPGGDAGELRAVSLFGRSGADGFDGMLGSGGPIARAHSVTELEGQCSVQVGVPSAATIVSERSSPQLYLSGILDRIPDEAIIAVAVPWPNGVLGRPSFVHAPDGQQRVGRFGWKGDVATLEEFVATAFRNELGVTSAARPTDLLSNEALEDCDGFGVREDDGRIVHAVTAYLSSLAPASPTTTEAHASGRAFFTELGCQTCHLPNGPTGDPSTPLYTDLLLHDMGDVLADDVEQGDAGSRDWRTTPLWGLGTRSRLLHDGRATTIEEAILAHGGEARVSTELYGALSPEDREALVGFLQSL